jgi:translocation and assembly module TamB
VRRLVWGVLGLVVLVGLVVAGALAWLTAPAGEKWVLAKGLPVANEQLSGKLVAGSVDLSLSGLTLRDVKLYTPEGELVAEVATVDARISLIALASKRVELTSAKLERPRLYLVQDERGLNLSRALAPRTPQAAQADTGPGSLHFSLKDFQLKDGYVDFVGDTEEGTRQVRLEDFAAQGSASYGAAKRSFDVRLEATGGLSRPLAGPVKLSVSGQGEEDNLSTDVNLTVAGLEFQGRGGMRGLTEAWMELKRLSLAPETARAFLPSWPLLVPVSVEGTGQKQGDVARTNLVVKAGSAKMNVDGSFNIATMRSDGLTVRAQDINLAELVADTAPTSIVANLTASGGGTSLETLDGQVELTISPSKFRNQPVGPVELSASAKDGFFTLSRLRVLVPGASLDARGQGKVDHIQVKGSLSASNLAVLGQTVGKLGPGPALPLSGSGALDFQLEGPLRTPGVEVSGSFASLGYEDNLIKGLNLKASLPNVMQPLTADASLVVDELKTGGRTFQNVSAAVTTRGRELEATVRTSGDAELGLTLAGTVDADQQGLAVKAMSLAWPEAVWTLQGSTHVGFGGGRIEVKPALTLVSDKQRLALTLVKEGEHVDGHVEVDTFDLTRLPKAFVPESLRLSGTVSAQVNAKGVLPRPDATLSMTLADGHFQEYSDINATLKGTYVKDRATGTLTAQVPAASLSADFDVPVQGLLRHRKDELSLKVNLAKLNIEEARKVLGRPEPLSGELSGLLEVTGPANEPRLAFTLKGEGLGYKDLPKELSNVPLTFTLSASSDETTGALSARFEAQGLAKQLYVTLKTPFTVGQMLVAPPTADQVMRTPLNVEGGLEELPLSCVGSLAHLQKAQGTVSAKFALNGSVLVPEGTLEIQAANASVSGLPPLDGHLLVTGGSKDIRAQLTALRHEGEQTAPLAELSATLEAPLGALQDPDVIGWVPFDVKARLHPTALKELMALAQMDPSQLDQGLQGVLSLELAARGTPAAPQVVLDVGLQQLGVGKLALGQAHAHYSYQDAHSALDATVSAPSGGTLLVRAEVPLEVSLPAIQQGPNVDKVPLDVTVKARQFDMSFLSGANEMVRSLGGVLEADARVAGTVGAPTLQGNVNWKEGKLGLMGFGEYHDIQVDLSVTEQRIHLEKLFARGGSGELHLTADATRSKGGAFEVTGESQLKEFPIVSDDQLVAVASLRATLEGSLTAEAVNIRNLTIPEAHIELPEVERKDLQPIERAGDIVLVRNGEPLDKKHRGTGVSSKPGTGGAGSKPPVQDAVEVDDTKEEVQRTYRILVNAPQNLWVRGADVNIELGLSPGFEVSYTNEAFLSGEVIVKRGRVDALGRRFDVQKDSRVNFTGPPLAPYLNITAEHVNEREHVTVFIHIRGQGKDFTIEPTSDPPMSETEIYTLLATGRRTLERNSGSSMTGAQAASVVGSLVASQAKKALAAQLPLDVFSIEAGDSGLAGTKLEVGKYLTDKIYVGYTGRVGTAAQSRENANAVRFEYQFTPAWSLEANYGDARSGGLDLIWSKDY